MGDDTILITGGAKRVGRLMAEHLARPGRTIVIHFNSSGEEAEALLPLLAAKGAKAFAVGQDLSTEDAGAGLIEKAAAAAGAPLSMLINNASVYDHDWPDAMDASVFARQMRVNAKAPMVIASEFQNQVQDDANNVVINILDQKLWNLHPHFYSYTASKAALLAATRMMDQAWFPATRVCGIAPGHLMPNVHQTDEEYDALASENLLQRPIDPEAVPLATEFILNTRSFHGQVVYVDNGLRFWKENWDLHDPTRK